MTENSIEERNIRIAKVMYLLQGLYIFWGITFLIAIVVNYVYRPEVRDSWLESHYRWSARTFWYGLLWSVIGGITFWFLIGMVILAINTLWIIYRVIRGWMNLTDKKAMYQS